MEDSASGLDLVASALREVHALGREDVGDDAYDAHMFGQIAACERGASTIRKLAALARPVPQGWQPIETAPIGNEHEGPFFDVAWAGEQHRYLPVMERATNCYRDGDVVKMKHGYPSLLTIFRPQPTHWMPLPEPPAALRTVQDRGDQPPSPSRTQPHD